MCAEMGLKFETTVLFRRASIEPDGIYINVDQGGWNGTDIKPLTIVTSNSMQN